MQRGFTTIKQFITVMILLSLSLSGLAQTKRTAPKPAKTTARQTCNGGWSGVVSYRKILKKSRDYGKKKNIARGETHIKYLRDYEYVGKLFVSASQTLHSFHTMGRTVLKDREADWKRYEQVEDCAGDRVNKQQVQWSETINDLVKDAFGEEKADFNLQVDESSSTYTFGFRFAEMSGTENRVDKVIKGGWCSARLNEGSDNNRKNQVTIEGEQFNYDEGKINPKTPNEITGSKIWDTGTPDVPGFTYDVSWTFRRCGSPLIITEVELFQPVHPSINNWKKIEKGNYTIDGNFVKVVAKVANISGEAKTVPIEFRESKENIILPEGKMPITVAANQEKEIVYLWDTSGYAWKESGDLNQPEINRQIEVKIPDDTKTENVEVRPKPVIVIPGFWTEKTSFSSFMSYFENLKSTHWAVDYARVLNSKSAAENAPEVAKRIKEMQERTNAWHVDLVGHSTGGLTGRVYIHSLMGQLADGKPTVTNFVMVATPNKGTPCSIGVDTIFSRFFNKSGEAYREITYKNMQEFNRKITARQGTKFYALVGHGYNKTCQMTTPGDGIVPAGSALWESRDFVKTHKYTPAPSTHEFILGQTSNMKVIHQWLAISPKGNHKPDGEGLTGGLRKESFDEFHPQQTNFGASFQRVSFQETTQLANAEDIEPTFGTGVKLKPNQLTEIETPVTAGKRIAFNMIAPKNVSITLLDANSTIVGKNLPGTPEAAAAFRLLSVDTPFQKGTWKLKLESKETEEAEIAIVVFIFQ
jgi:hypothetical protein